MRSVAVAASALAFAASAMAQVEGFAVMSSPAKDEKINAGKTYSIQWDAGKYSGPVVISLLGGSSPETLEVGDQIAAGVPITSDGFSWNVDCKLGTDSTYGLKIASQADESLFQYSFPFHIDNSDCDEEGGDQGGSYPTIGVSGSGYPTGGYGGAWSSDCSTSSAIPTVAPTISVPAPVVTEAPSSYAATSAPPAATSAPATSAAASTPAAPSSSMATKVSSAAPSTSAKATEAPSASAEPSIVPVAGAGRNAAGSLAALAGVAAAIFAL